MTELKGLMLYVVMLRWNMFLKHDASRAFGNELGCVLSSFPLFLGIVHAVAVQSRRFNFCHFWEDVCLYCLLERREVLFLLLTSYKGSRPSRKR
jgi:hypothetical protein